jgi:hypothetical protein
MLPGIKEQILGQGLNVLKEALAGASLLSDALVGGINEVQDGMEQESENVEGEQRHGEVVLAMTKIMLQVIALGFEDIVVFILAFPSGPSGMCQQK